MLKETEEWAYSLNGIDYGDIYSNKSDAFQDALEEAKEYGEESFFLGHVEKFVPRVDIADDLIYQLREQAKEVVGCNDGYLEYMSHDEMAELNHEIEKVLFAWAGKYLRYGLAGFIFSTPKNIPLMRIPIKC